MKVTISLPQELLHAAETERETTGETRSEFFRRAVESLLRREREREEVERYVRGYREQPETEEEVAAAEAMGAWAISREPWE